MSETIEKMDNLVNIDDLGEKENHVNEPNINLKKIKYKLKKGSIEDYISIYELKLNEPLEINCSKDFFENKFGKSLSGYLEEEKKEILYEWCVIVKTSNNQTYKIIITPNIYTKEEIINDGKNTCDFKKWYVYGDNYKYLDYNKLSKLFNFEYKNFLKKQEKINKNAKIHNKNININIHNKLVPKFNNLQQDDLSYKNVLTKKNNKPIEKIHRGNFIDEIKYNNINTEKFLEYSDDDLACILFTRFKNSSNSLLKEALIIHKTLNGLLNNNIEKKLNDSNNKNKRDKSKYNNKSSNKK